jgi:ABC-type transporter Mla subunit MlaD
MAMKIKGIQTGEVKSVFLTEDNLIEVNFKVFQEYSGRIRKDSVVKKRSPLIGAKYLEIIPGEANMPVLASGSYVWSEDTEEGKRILNDRLRVDRPEQIQRILNNVEEMTYKLSSDEEKLMVMLTKAGEFMDLLNDEEGDLNQILDHIEAITKSIVESEGSIGKMIYDDYEMYEQITATMTNLSSMTENLDELSEMLADSSPEVKTAMQNVNRAMDNAIGLMTTLQNSVWLRSASKKTEQSLQPKPIEGDVREGGYAPELDYDR